jgi:toxin secretion/phage lysis holin
VTAEGLSRLKTVAAGAGLFLAGLLGGADPLLYTLVGFTAADCLTGILKAVIRRELRSARMFSGGLRKLLIYVVVAVAAALDNLFPADGLAFRGLTIGYYIANEGLSILENAALCGLPLPERLKSVLAGMTAETLRN